MFFLKLRSNQFHLIVSSFSNLTDSILTTTRSLTNQNGRDWIVQAHAVWTFSKTVTSPKTVN